jgi:hypothetical protein
MPLLSCLTMLLGVGARVKGYEFDNRSTGRTIQSQITQKPWHHESSIRFVSYCSFLANYSSMYRHLTHHPLTLVNWKVASLVERLQNRIGILFLPGFIFDDSSLAKRN